MSRPIRPGVDRTIEPLSGSTRDGQPLSYNRAPAPDLAPWIGRLYVTAVDAPADHVLSCGLFNDSSFVRIQLRGRWLAETLDGRHEMGKSVLFFGPHTRRMPITVTGPFLSIGFSFCPGAGHVLFRRRVSDHLDRLVKMETLGLNPQRLMNLRAPDADPEDWCCALEGEIRKIVDAAGGIEPDGVTRRFESISHVDPSISVAQFAADCGIEQRRLERLVRRDFGMPPKQVLRRARALDMASHLRGVADQSEAEELALRYYDQSHLIRDFSHYFGMSPRQFVETPQPLMTLALETRQARRLEMIERLAPGDVRPWE